MQCLTQRSPSELTSEDSRDRERSHIELIDGAAEDRDAAFIGRFEELAAQFLKSRSAGEGGRTLAGRLKTLS
jgi:hypothetical protein